MSAKLLKSLAAGSCLVRNSSNIEVIVYWKNDINKLQHCVIRPGTTVDMLKLATVAQLRKSINMKELFSKGLLQIADS